MKTIQVTRSLSVKPHHFSSGEWAIAVFVHLHNHHGDSDLFNLSHFEIINPGCHKNHSFSFPHFFPSYHCMSPSVFHPSPMLPRSCRSFLSICPFSVSLRHPLSLLTIPPSRCPPSFICCMLPSPSPIYRSLYHKSMWASCSGCIFFVVCVSCFPAMSNPVRQRTYTILTSHSPFSLSPSLKRSRC